MEPPKSVSVVVVSHNTSALLQDCLAAVAGEGSGVVRDVVVVDNASADDSVPMLRRWFPDAVVIENHRNVGFGIATNQGVAAADGRYVLLLNSDAMVEPRAIGRMVAELRAHPSVGLVGPRLINVDGSVQRSAFRFPTPVTLLLEQTNVTTLFAGVRGAGSTCAVDWIVGACMLGERALLRELGPFDPSFFMYGEDVDLCLRLWQRGSEVRVVPDARVVHLGGGSSMRYADRRVLWWTDSIYRFYRKHSGRGQLQRAALVLRALALLKAAWAAWQLPAASGGEAARWRDDLRTWRAVATLAPDARCRAACHAEFSR